MNPDREKNGPTQVHPPITYNDITTHMNGIGPIGLMGKPFGGE
jgi:hypothetical protein